MQQNRMRIWDYVFISLCLIVLLFFLVGSAQRESPTYDEITYVEAGYQFLVNKDFRFDPFNPPLAKEILALPALINKNVIYDRVIFWPRMMTISFTLALAVLIYIFSKRLYGGLAAKLAIILYIFEPNILSHGHYATADLIFTFFLFLALFCFWVWRNKFTYKKIIIFSIIIGLLLSTKLTSIPFLLFPLAVLFVMEKRNKKELIKLLFWKKRIWLILLFIFITSLTLWSTYFFKLEPPLGYRFDINRPAIKLSESNPLVKIALTLPVPLGSYLSTIKQVALFNYSNLYIKRSYFLGNLSLDGSPGYYLPIVFLIKTPLPLLIFFLLCLLLFSKNVKNGKYLLVPLFFIFFNVLFSKYPLAIRYILPAYPLVIVYSSQIVNIGTVSRKLLNLFLGIMLTWYIIGTIKEFPHFISYMNELTEGANNRYKYLVDSNYDWGQGLIALKDYQDNNNINNLQFAYFGSIDPAKYGIRYEKIKNLNIKDNEVKELKFDQNHTIAISSTCWYFCGYYKNPDFKNISPVEVVGGSILIFRKQ